MTNDGLNSASEAQPTPPPYLAIAVGMFLVLAIVVIAIVFRPRPDPYTQSVLVLSGNPTQGRAIFVMNCVDCHGQWANGKVGPSLRNISERLSSSQIVHQVVSGDTPPMPQFQPKPQDMADLLSYLKSL